MKHHLFTLSAVMLLLGCSQSRANEDWSQTSLRAASYSSIYWSDGDSGRLAAARSARASARLVMMPKPLLSNLPKTKRLR